MVAAKSEMPRVVITGIGVVSPVGIGKDAFWRSLLAGRSGISFLKAFSNKHLPCRLTAEIKDFNPLIYMRRKKLLKVMSRDIQLGVSAASLAMNDARMKSFYERMVKAKLNKPGLDYRKAYTLQFVNKGVGLNLRKP